MLDDGGIGAMLHEGSELSNFVNDPSAYEGDISYCGYGWIIPRDGLPDELIRLLNELADLFVEGRPWHFAEFWQLQTVPSDVSVAVQQGILASFGIEVTQAELIEIARENGWLTEDGASFADWGKLLEHYGVETRAVLDGNVDLLRTELEAGNRVIVPIDPDELRANGFFSELWENFLDMLGISDATYPVWVTGYDALSDPPTVMINDSGDPDGARVVIPLSEFLDLCEGRNFSFITTGTGEELPGTGEELPGEPQ